MSKKIIHTESRHELTIFRIVTGGMILFLLIVLLAGKIEFMNTEKLSEDILSTLKNQCSSYDKLMAADCTKSLFRLTDMLREFSNRMAEEPELLTDEYLEQYIDSVRLSGIAVLDENLMLQVSGYTRQFRDAEWMQTPSGEKFADIIDHPAKVYAERIEMDGDYYDVCAVARKDAPGIIVGYYKQPADLIAGTESDLESLLTGLNLERKGNYAVTKNDVVCASSQTAIRDKNVSDNDVLRHLSQIKKDGHLHLICSGKKYYWGYRSGYEKYRLFVYYPFFEPFSSAFVISIIGVSIYSVLFLILFAVRNRILLENQKKLEESNSQLEKTVEMLQSLETIYFSLFYVDLVNDGYETIYVAPWLKNVIPQSGVYTELRQRFLNSMTVPSYRSEVDLRMSCAFIQDALSRDNITDVRKSFYTDFQAIRNGEVKWCRVSATVVNYDEAGIPLHALALLQDVDEEKVKEAAYQDKILEESRNAKMANNAKAEFLRRISHDIKTPINGAMGYLNMEAREPENLALQKYCREKIAVSLDTLLGLVNSVLEMSDMEGHEIQLEEKAFDLEVLLQEVDTVVKPQAIEKNINCEILQKEQLPVNHVIGSPRHVSQIFMNLAMNGVKFGRQKGWFRLNTRLISETEQTLTYEFCFEDNGIGMSEEFQKHLYEPFVQETSGARSTYEGTGLGLAIVKKLVDALGGTITVHSEKNIGTRFCVQLTFRIDEKFYASTQKKRNGNADNWKNLHILLVEDNELNMEIAEYFLTNHGAKVTKSWNGKQAVEAFKASEPGYFELIIMDIMMPEMNGLEASSAIRALDREDAGKVIIVAMSANAFENDIQKSREAGMNAHIAKPVDEKKLVEVINGLLVKDRQKECRDSV